MLRTLLVPLLLFGLAGPAAAQTAPDPEATINPDSLPILGDTPVIPANARTFLWTKGFELTYPRARWELEINDGNGHVKLQGIPWDATLEVTAEVVEAAAPAGRPAHHPTSAPANTDATPVYRVALGGNAATETVGWFDEGEGRPAWYEDALQCSRAGRLTRMVLTAPEKSQAALPAIVADLREIQRSWRWHAAPARPKP